MSLKISLTTALLLAGLAAVATFAQPSGDAKTREMTLRLELFVSDLPKSIDFYTRVLGFERQPGSPTYVPVRSGAVVIGLGPAAGLPKQHPFNPELQTARRGLGAEIVLEVDDVERYFERVKASGYQAIRSPLRKQSWGLTDFRLTDPDGYYLRITSR
jgi:catechol 2,3-dioxygenase-like lactoylglutathione lyase family enzyme